MTRIGIDSDFWGNEETKALSNDVIHAIVNFPPGEIPLMRIREGDGMSENVSGGGLFFYDILPIEAHFQFKDRVERGDIFFFSIEDEQHNKIPIVLKVIEPLGSFTTQLIWRKFQCAPITGLHEIQDEDVKARILEKVGVVK